MNFCRKCALLAASLCALGAGQAVTPEQVDQARVSLCQAASYPVKGDGLIYAAIAQYGENRPEANVAMSRALFEYITDRWEKCANPEATKRLDDILHGPHETGPQTS